MPAKKKPFPTVPKVMAANKNMLEAVPEIELKGATTPIYMLSHYSGDCACVS